MDYSLLAYLFVCFSIGLFGLGVSATLVAKSGTSLARVVFALHIALSVTVMANLLLAFLDTLATPVDPVLVGVLEYVESIVGFYTILLLLPLVTHRVLGIDEARRERLIAAGVAAALVVQHVTEYGMGGVWDERGDLLENLLFVLVLGYSLAQGVIRSQGPGTDTHLAKRFVLVFALAVPGLLHDLFLLEVSPLRIYPLWYCGFSLVVRSLIRPESTSSAAGPPSAWGLTDRETEVARLVMSGLSNKEIGAELHISPNTVKTHLRAVFDKSGCRSRFALMSQAGHRDSAGL